MSVAETLARLQADACELLELDPAIDDKQLARSLGEACRRSPQGVVVWCAGTELTERLSAERFYAFGFRRVLDVHEEGIRHVLYEYRLADYKQPPDWLNARYWAHPERFDLDPDELPDEDGVHP